MRCHCDLMGDVIDITDKLRLLRRAHELAKDVQRSQLRLATRLIQIIEDEVQRQMLVLCDENASEAQVDEAIALMPLLTELLMGRRDHLKRLEAEFLRSPDWATLDG